MNNQKIENLLNLALDATPEELEKSLSLETGYEGESDLWEVIVKYSGEIWMLREEGIEVLELMNQFAILKLTREQLNRVVEYPQILYVEQPKRLYFQRENGNRVSCVTPLQRAPYNLTGAGVIVAVLDSGIDISNSEFRYADGQTRVLVYWDQGTNQIYEREDINQILDEENNPSQIGSLQDRSGHGTAVCGIAAGSNGVAPGADLLVVKLGVPRENSFPRTTELMRGIDYAIRYAAQVNRPLAMNISIGNTYGAHVPYY